MWTQFAKCANDEEYQRLIRENPDADPLFDGGNSKWANKYCSDCPVKNECLCESLQLQVSFGYWGGLSPKARTRLMHRGRIIQQMLEVQLQTQSQDD